MAQPAPPQSNIENFFGNMIKEREDAARVQAAAAAEAAKVAAAREREEAKLAVIREREAQKTAALAAKKAAQAEALAAKRAAAQGAKTGTAVVAQGPAPVQDNYKLNMKSNWDLIQVGGQDVWRKAGEEPAFYYVEALATRIPPVYSWSDANRLCNQTIDGVTGWRLPTPAEVKSTARLDWVDDKVGVWTSPTHTRNGKEGQIGQISLACVRPIGGIPAQVALQAAAPAKPPASVTKPSTPASLPVLTKIEPPAPLKQPEPAPLPKTYEVETSRSFGRTAKTAAEARALVEAEVKRAGNGDGIYKRSDPVVCKDASYAFGGVAPPVMCEVKAYYTTQSRTPPVATTPGTPCKEQGCGIAR